MLVRVDNHCFRAKKIMISILNVCVSLTLAIQHTKRLHHITLFLVIDWLQFIFLHLLKSVRIICKKFLKLKFFF
jgi:hypothetical protein